MEVAGTRSRMAPPGQVADLFGAALGHCDNGVIILDDQAKVIFWNHWMADASGVAVTAAQGRTLAELFPGTNRARIEQAIRQALQSRQSSVLSRALNPEILPLVRHGREREAIEHQAIVKAIDARGGLFCLVQVFDVTDAIHRERFLRSQASELTRMANDLAASGQALLTMLEASPIGVAIISDDGIIRFANSRLATLFLASGSNITGLRADEFFTHPRNLLGAIDRAVDRMEVRFRRRDGSQLWAQVSAEPTRFEQQSAILCWVYDISDHKKAERDLTSERDRATEMVRARTEFLAMVSHEIRTPLNGILGTLRMLQETPLNEAQQGHMEMIRYSGDALLAILNDVLDISRLEAGHIRLEMQPFDMTLLIDNLVLLMAGRAAEKGLDLRTQIDAGFEAQVIADGGRIRQVLLNLIGNALKFTDEGTITVRLEQIDSSDRQVRMRLSVIDSGIGIPREARDQLFTEFFQVDHAMARRVGGTGLGLAISKRIVEAMGGAIGVESTPGVGSTFWFTLSLERQNPAVTRARNSGARLRPTRPGNILLVEDNEINQKVGLNLLRREGHTVTIADTGREAVALAAKSRFDIVLMDIRLPEMDGLEATRAIRAPSDQDHASVPIVAVTANAMPDDTRRFLEAGMIDVLTKPIDPDRLSRVIALAMGEQNIEQPQSSVIARIEGAMIESLRSTIGSDRVDELIELFDTTSKSTIEEMKAAATAGRPEVCAALAHRLKGGALNLGLTSVSDAALALEVAVSTERDTDALDSLISDLSEAHQATIRALRIPQG